MEESILYAKKYLEDILSFFGLNTDVYATHEDDVIELSVPSTHLNSYLIGQHGDTLRSLQFLVSNALKNNEHEYVRVNIDIADYKKHRQDRLAEKAEGWIKKVRDSGEKMELRPMNAADRRIVHRTVSESRGVESSSEGEGRDRHVVISAISLDDEED
jgi:spoIIIJ-associated protein